MSEAKKTFYEVSADFNALFKLVQEATTEDGEERDFNEEDKKILEEFFKELEPQFEQKFDGCCKFFKNLQYQSDLAKSEKDAFKAEMDRLQKRSKAFENRAASFKMYIWTCMQKLGLAKNGFKTALFSAKEQATAGAVNTLAGLYDYKNIPEKFLKEPELDKAAIKEALKDGTLFQKDEKEFPLSRGKLYFMQDGKEQELKGVSFLKGTTFIIR
ncbi:MAG: siphovirus Gp157 family protein [Treponema phagedenis]|uniref:siphovirus Gp157 family protein n=1 Tax=Treponema phagedenis TaxID=162 RepID=UPI003133DF63